MRKLLLLLMFCGASSLSVPVAAQFISQRFLPTNGERGILGPTQDFPAVKIGKRDLLLSPGARIYDQQNRTIVHASLPPGAEIVYSRDPSGAIQRIYILTEQEIERLRAAGKR